MNCALYALMVMDEAASVWPALAVDLQIGKSSAATCSFQILETATQASWEEARDYSVQSPTDQQWPSWSQLALPGMSGC